MSIPKDGYYMAKVQLDTGGEHQRYVRVKGGKLHDEEGEELLPQACEDFNELSTVMMAWVWPEDAAIEIHTLRTTNAGLLKEVGRLTDEAERLEAWKASVVAVEAKWDAQAIAAMLGSRLGESTRTAIQREVPLLLDRAKRLHAAGQDAVDYIDGKHAMRGRVIEGWRKATG